MIDKKPIGFIPLNGRNAFGRPRKKKEEIKDSYVIDLFFGGQVIKNLKTNK